MRFTFVVTLVRRRCHGCFLASSWRLLIANLALASQLTTHGVSTSQSCSMNTLLTKSLLLVKGEWGPHEDFWQRGRTIVLYYGPPLYSERVLDPAEPQTPGKCPFL